MSSDVRETFFREEFNRVSDLSQRSIMDFLCVQHETEKTSGNLFPRSNTLDFEGEILPVLKTLCPSFRLNWSAYNSEQRLQYNLSWNAGDLHVPDFIIEESDRQFNEWIELFGFADEEEAAPEELEKRFDPYDMLPLDLF